MVIVISIWALKAQIAGVEVVEMQADRFGAGKGSLAPVVVPSLAPVVGSSGVPLNKDLRSTTLQVDLLLRHLSIEATYNKRSCISAYKQRAVDARDFCRVHIRIR